MDFLAVSTPGMRWIPVFLLLTGMGWLAGIIGAIGVRCGQPSMRFWGWLAIAFGVLTPILIAFFAHDSLILPAFAIMATPIAPGLIAVLYRKPQPPTGFSVVVDPTSQTTSSPSDQS